MVNLLKIKQIAEQRKISIEALAEAVGLSAQQLHLIVRKNSTKIETLERIANALDVSIVVFFEDGQPQGPGLVHTEGDFSPASGTGDVSVVGCDALLSERVKALERQVAEKDARIADLKDTIQILKSSLPK